MTYRKYYIESICSICSSRKISNQGGRKREKEGREKRKTEEIGDKRIEERQVEKDYIYNKYDLLIIIIKAVQNRHNYSGTTI